MSAIWNTSQEAAGGQERPVTYEDGMAGTNLKRPFACVKLQVSFMGLTKGINSFFVYNFSQY